MTDTPICRFCGKPGILNKSGKGGFHRSVEDFWNCDYGFEPADPTEKEKDAESTDRNV